MIFSIQKVITLLLLGSRNRKEIFLKSQILPTKVTFKKVAEKQKTRYHFFNHQFIFTKCNLKWLKIKIGGSE